MLKIYLENYSMRHIVFPSELTHYKNVWTVYLLVLHSLILKKKNVSLFILYFLSHVCFWLGGMSDIFKNTIIH